MCYFPVRLGLEMISLKYRNNLVFLSRVQFLFLLPCVMEVNVLNLGNLGLK